VFPVGEQRSESGYECQRLVEDQVVVCVRDRDERCVAAGQFVHVCRSVLWHDRAELAAKECNPAAYGEELIAQRNQRLMEEMRIESPRPAGLGFVQRESANVIDNELVLARLGWNEPEVA
jgi:hypothetical protein